MRYYVWFSQIRSQMHSAIPLHQPSAASLNSDNSSSDFIFTPQLPHCKVMTIQLVLCVTPQLCLSVILPLSLKILCVLRLLCEVHFHLVHRSHRPPAQLVHT